MENKPDIKEIQKDLSEYLTKKYGQKVRLAGLGLDPEPHADNVNDQGKEQHQDKVTIHFDMKPAELKAYLDEYVVKQDAAKMVLATKICTHFNRIKRFEMQHKDLSQGSIGEIKNNIIMIGPTGVGKTYLIKLIAAKIGVPFVKGDATKFSETGYVGGDVEDLVRDLVYEADGNIELAQYGIIYLDEVDKIVSSRNMIGPDVSRSGVQRALLKPLEETEVELKVAHDPVSQMEAMMEFQKTGKRERKKINTRHILFIMSGAFTGLEDIVRKRLSQHGVGFKAEITSKDDFAIYLKMVKSVDLIEFGFESEFIGRLPVITLFEYLEVEDLYHILQSRTNPIIKGKMRDFKAYNIDLQFQDEALRLIAENANHERTGARGLVSAVERVLLEFEHQLPSTSISQLVVTPAMVKEPHDELKKIMQHPNSPAQDQLFQELRKREEDELGLFIRQEKSTYQSTYKIDLTEGRIKLITTRALQERLNHEVVVQELREVIDIVHNFEQQFVQRNDIRINFDNDAIDSLLVRVWHDKIEPATFLKDAFQNYEHGLKLVGKKTNTSEFTITADGILNPEKYLNTLIREIYQADDIGKE